MTAPDEARAYRTLNSLGWEWYEDGAVVTAVVNGNPVRVFVPLRRLTLTFGQELDLPTAVGCVGCTDLVQTIGACARSLDSAPVAIGRRSRSERRSRRRRRRSRRRRRRRKFFRGLGRAARRVTKAVAKVAKGVLKIATSKVAQGLVAAIGTAVPVLAPAAAAIATAQGVVRKVAAGLDAAKRIRAGDRNPQLGRVVQQGLAAKRTVDVIASRAKQGDRRAQEFAGGLAAVAAGRAG